MSIINKMPFLLHHCIKEGGAYENQLQEIMDKTCRAGTQ